MDNERIGRFDKVMGEINLRFAKMRAKIGAKPAEVYPYPCPYCKEEIGSELAVSRHWDGECMMSHWTEGGVREV